MRTLSIILTIILLPMLATVGVLKHQNKKLKAEVVMLEHDAAEKMAQYESMVWDNQNALTLSRYEYSQLETRMTEKLNQALKKSNIKLKEVVSATQIENNYIDTSKVKAVKKEPEIKDNSYIIPVSWDDGCWGMTGEIITSDKLADLSILNRKFSNLIHLVVTREKRFLFIRLKKAEYKVLSDCGDPVLTSIKFTK